MAETARLFLIDGSALAYRSYFAFIRRPLINSKGENTSAPYGFTNSILKILRDENPEYIAVVFDTKAPTFRHKIYPEYKSTRAKMPEEMADSLPRVFQVLEAMNMPVIEMDGYEADDIIGTLAKAAAKKGVKVVMVTGDKDFFQLVGKNIEILNPRTSGAEMEWLDPQGVERKFGLPPEKIVDALALMGDKSDNIPGVPGIGEKTAIPLLQKFDSLEEILDEVEKIEQKGLRDKIKNNREAALFSKKLVTIDTKVPVELNLEKFRQPSFNTKALKKLFEELEFSRLVKWIEIPKAEGVKLEEKEKGRYRLIDSIPKLKKLTAEIKKRGSFSFDTETTSLDPITAELVGISFSLVPKEGYYLPLGHLSRGREKNLDLQGCLSLLKPLLEDEKTSKIGQNLKYDRGVLLNYGIELRGIAFDTMVASYLLNPSARQHNLSNLAEKYLDYKMIEISELIGTGKKQKSFAEVPIDLALKYSAEDADIALRLKGVLEPLLKKNQLEELFNKVEMPLVPVLCDMESAGVSLDTKILRKMSASLEKQMERLTSEIYSLVGCEFNINSPIQLRKILFEDLKLPPGRKTEKGTGRSTDVEVLEQLSKLHPLPRKILEYRQLSKLKSTYADALFDLINPKTNRVHTSFNQTVTATGRLSSSDPNLQNIPIRTEMGRELRRAFVPATEDNLILSADYSQIELRVLAHFSRDKTLTESFKRGEDIHARTASEIYGVRIDKVIPEMRRQAKTVNFAIMYGVTAYGLSQQTDLSTSEAKKFMDIYFGRYPGVKKYIEGTIDGARSQGYVTTLLGRRRYLPEISSKNRQVREFAERTAINTPIQGTAADMIKVAMVNIWRELKRGKLETKMILQVHDELVFEVPQKELETVRNLVKKKMETALKLSVPVKVDIGVAGNWLEAH
ncbi:MAG: DNA polymerase I [Candidatus Zixiibacteriota bacterium]|nr:MAG: DNA polymerase I [candidate division Zixibacteria bacterium]